MRKQNLRPPEMGSSRDVVRDLNGPLKSSCSIGGNHYSYCWSILSCGFTWAICTPSIVHGEESMQCNCHCRENCKQKAREDADHSNPFGDWFAIMTSFQVRENFSELDMHLPEGGTANHQEGK